MKDWYKFLVEQDPKHRRAYKRSKGTWLVRDWSEPLEVLDLHKTLRKFDLLSSFPTHISEF